MSPDLGPKPEPRIEPGEPNPGGVDAVDADSGPILIPDLPPEENPAFEGQASGSVADQVSGSEDTSTQATDGGVEEAGAEAGKESSA
jgi:hypothetical protein